MLFVTSLTSSITIFVTSDVLLDALTFLHRANTKYLSDNVQRKWRSAREHVEENPNSIYQTFGRNRRLVLHELCKVVSFPVTEDNKGDVSDDEDEEAADQSGACPDCVKEENSHITSLIRYMIETSHGLGPVRFPTPSQPPDDEDANANDEDEPQAPQLDENDHHSFQIHESILTVTDVLGKTPLHVLCESSADRSALEVILDCTRENSGNLSAPTALSLIGARDSNGSTPLHYLSYSRVCPYSSLVLLMDHCCPETGQGLPDPTILTDMDGDTPLHWAFDGYMSPRRIKQLIRYHKKALWVKNSLGRRPLDQFVENFVDADWYLHELCGREVWENIQGYLKVMSDQYEEEGSSGAPGEEEKPAGWFPVHTLASSIVDFPSVFLDIALFYSRDEVSKEDSNGHLPLHLACGRRSGHPDTGCDGIVATKILAANTQAAFQRAPDTGRLPIHIAIASEKPLPLIAALLKVYPSSLNVLDPVTGLHPFLLSGLCNDGEITVTYGLLRADPSIVRAMVSRPPLSRGGSSCNSLASYNSELSDDTQEQASKMLKTRLRFD